MAKVKFRGKSLSKLSRKKKAKQHKGKEKTSVARLSKHCKVPFKCGKTMDERRKALATEMENHRESLRTNIISRNRNIQVDMLSFIDEPCQSTSAGPVVIEMKNDENVCQTFKKCYKEFKKVVDAADIILEVLDARDPLGTRCLQVEQSVLNAGDNKRLVLVLNKIDLIPRDNLDKWLRYLRQELPTVAFKASTQSQNRNLCRSKVAAIHMNENLRSSRACVGANFLMKVLGNYCRSHNIMTSIKVGVVGIPNVGKSSIINSLKRARSCTVGATPGVTKNMAEILLDKHIRLLDSPGIVFVKEGSESSLALHNALKIEKLNDVITPAEAVVRRTDCNQLMSHYNIPNFSTPEELFFHLAQKMGRFKKGGIPDVEAAARKILNDWNHGIIKYYTHPPEVYKPMIHISSELVTVMSKEFDISSLEDRMELDKAISSSIEENTNEQIKSTMDVDKEEITVNLKRRKDRIPESISGLDRHRIIGLEYFQNRIRKAAYKLAKKKRKRDAKQAEELSEQMVTAMSFNS